MDELYLQNGVHLDYDMTLFKTRAKTDFDTPIKIGKIQIGRHVSPGLRRLFST